MAIPDQSVSPEHPHTETDFSHGINLAQLDQVSGAQLEQLIREATPTQNKALIIIQDTVPDVAGNPRYKRYAWIKCADTNPGKWTLRFWKGPGYTEADWVIATGEFDAGSIPLMAISITEGVNGYFLGLKDGKLQYLPIPPQIVTNLDPTSGIAPGNPWQLLMTDANKITKWKNFVDFATANSNIMPVAFLEKGTPGYAIINSSEGFPKYAALPSGPAENRLVPTGGTAGQHLLGVVGDTRAWVDANYLVNMLPINSFKVNKLQPVVTPTGTDMIFWSGPETGFINGPLFKSSGLIALATPGVIDGNGWVIWPHNYTAPSRPQFITARFHCTSADAGFQAGNQAEYASVEFDEHAIPFWTDDTHMKVKIKEGSDLAQILNPFTFARVDLNPASWSIEFRWI